MKRPSARRSAPAPLPGARPPLPRLAAALLAAALGLSAAPAAARVDDPACRPAAQGAPLKVALVTSSSGGLIFNSMGHTAIWFSGGPLDEGLVYNWGAYDGTRPDLGPAFLSGQMNFWLADEVWAVQWRRNLRQQRSVVVQVLDVPQAEAQAMLRKLQVEVLPENREFRYHWALDNCATRARDVVNTLVGGQLETALSTPAPWTARHEGARHLSRYPVAAFAWDFMAGPYVDQPLTDWQLGMVPERLMESVQGVVLRDPDGATRPLVTARCDLREGEYSWARPHPLPGWPVAAVTTALSALMVGLGLRPAGAARRLSGAMLGLWGLTAGLLGLITFVMWAISSLDGVGPTYSWLQASPLTLALAAAGLQRARLRAWGPLLRGLTFALAGIGVAGLIFKPLIPQDNLHMVAVFLPPLLGAAALAWRAPGDGRG